MIYFIRDTGSGHIKIGTSVTPWKRLKYLQTGVPTQLEMLAVIEGTAEDEARLHMRFDDEHVRGEWYRGEGALAAFVAARVGAGSIVHKPASNHGSLDRIHRLTGVSVSYLCQIRKGQRAPPLVLAAIFEGAGVKLGPLANFTDEEVSAWAKVMAAFPTLAEIKAAA